MIRIVCPGCHTPLSSAELEQATIDGHLSLVCPECSMVLLTEPVEEHTAQQPAETPLHA
jgi:phage FluMu protein Com